ncbi:MAG: DUF4381 domain-containing protein [Verrucomicrobiales bacterium]|nr:DUF4381 domain-containing protein [Verrucomicrobiales bacterium]
MSDSATSLDRLHDLVPPPAISWWPLAPGWYLVAVLVLGLLLLCAFRAWKKWRQNAYRREALQKLSDASEAAEVAEILRRTALAVAPRNLISATTGDNWADWLDSQVAEPMSDEVRREVSRGIYDPSPVATPIDDLKRYAESWIRKHSSELELASPTS